MTHTQQPEPGKVQTLEGTSRGVFNKLSKKLKINVAASVFALSTLFGGMALSTTTAEAGTLTRIVDSEYRFTDVLPIVDNGAKIIYSISDQNAMGGGVNTVAITPFKNGAPITDKEYQFVLNAKGKVNLDDLQLGFAGLDYDGIRIQATNPLNTSITSNDVSKGQEWATSLARLNESENLYLIHSAELNWDTKAYVMNNSTQASSFFLKFVPKDGVELSQEEEDLLNEDISLSVKPFGTLELSLADYLPRELFGKISRWDIQEGGTTPFYGNHANLKGFQTYSKLNYSDTSQELNQIGANKLMTSQDGSREFYLAHVTDDSFWWTGAAVFNKNDEPANVTYKAFNKEGALISEKTYQVAGNSKQVGLVEDLANVPLDQVPNLSHVVIESDKELLGGIELFGHPNTELNEMSGLAALTQKDMGFELEFANNYVDADNWSGVAVLNTSETVIPLLVEAYDEAGHVIGSGEYELQANQKLVGLAEHLVTFESGYGPLQIAKVKATDTRAVERTTTNPALLGFTINGAQSHMKSGAQQAQTLDQVTAKAYTTRSKYNYGETATLKLDLTAQGIYDVIKNVFIDFNGGTTINASIEDINSPEYKGEVQMEIDPDRFAEVGKYSPTITMEVENSETGDTKLYQRDAEDFVAGTTSDYKMTTLLQVKTPDGTVYSTQGVTTDESLMRVLLNTQDISAYVGSRNWGNVKEPEKLQAMIDRVNSQFSEDNFYSVFNETKQNLNPFLNDLDNDGFAIDGTANLNLGNGIPDPDGWTVGIQVQIEKYN